MSKATSDAMEFLPLFLIRYVSDTTAAKALPWPEFTVPLISWFLNLKRDFLPGMRKVSAYMIGDALYNWTFGYARVKLPLSEADVTRLKSIKGTGWMNQTGQAAVPSDLTTEEIDMYISQTRAKAKNFNIGMHENSRGMYPTGQRAVPASILDVTAFKVE